MTFLFGGLLIIGGTFVLFGAISGRLAAMIGAIVGIGEQSSGGGPLINPLPGIPYTSDPWATGDPTSGGSAGGTLEPAPPEPVIPELPPVTP